MLVQLLSHRTLNRPRPSRAPADLIDFVDATEFVMLQIVCGLSYV